MKNGYNYNSSEISQSPSRREVHNIWEPSVYPENIDDVFSNFDSYDSHDSKYYGSDYNDYPNLPVEPMEQQNTTFVDLNQKESALTAEQLIKNNNQYDSYSPNGDVYRYSSDEDYLDEPVKRQRPYNYKKYISKNSCRQYLEFLKYAFQSLEETPEAKYEYANDYVDDMEPKEGKEKLPQNKQFPFPQPLNVVNKNENENGNGDVKVPSYTALTTLSPTPKTPTFPSPTFGKSTSPFPTTFDVSRGRENPTSTAPWNGNSNVYSSTVGQATKQTASETISMSPIQTDSERSFVRVTEKTMHDFGKSHQQRIQWETRDPGFKTFDRSTIVAAEGMPGQQRWLFPDNYYKNIGTEQNETKSTTISLNDPEITSSRGMSTAQGRESSTANVVIPSLTPKYRNSTKVAFQGMASQSIDRPKNLEECNDKNLPCPGTILLILLERGFFFKNQVSPEYSLFLYFFV